MEMRQAGRWDLEVRCMLQINAHGWSDHSTRTQAYCHRCCNASNEASRKKVKYTAVFAAGRIDAIFPDGSIPTRPIVNELANGEGQHALTSLEKAV
jgi:hypothetical protein